jgi:hypothetical protein
LITISAPRIATPAIAPALPPTTTEPEYMLSPTPQPTLLSMVNAAPWVRPAQKYPAEPRICTFAGVVNPTPR